MSRVSRGERARSTAYYWIMRHCSLRTCQWLFDRSADFRLWWGADAPPLPKETL